jgi:hypothetical protein
MNDVVPMLTSFVLAAVVGIQWVIIRNQRVRYTYKVMAMKHELADDLAKVQCKKCGSHLMGMYTAAEIES